MADDVSIEALEALLKRLPREEDEPERFTRRVRITTVEGNTVSAYVRAGKGTLSFGGWEKGRQESTWAYFVLGAEKAGDPLQLISQRGLLGTVSAAELEERSEADAE
jgi:hypothetical protein